MKRKSTVEVAKPSSCSSVRATAPVSLSPTPFDPKPGEIDRRRDGRNVIEEVARIEERRAQDG